MGGSSGGGSSGGTNVNYIRYAPYIESKHSTFLVNSESIGNNIRNDSPYAGYQDLDFTDGLYSAGYGMSSFPSLYDMFGKFMSGLDLETLWAQIQHSVQNDGVVENLVNSHRALLNDDIEQAVLPRFNSGIRDLNAVMTSSYIVGRSIIEQGAVKKVAEFSATLRYKLIPGAIELFTKHLGWNAGVVSTYLDILKTAVAIEMDTKDVNYGYARRDIMWPFTVMEQERANLGALQGAKSAPAGGGGAEASTGSKVLGGAMAGASIGASTGNPYAALAGGVIGGIAGAFS